MTTSTSDGVRRGGRRRGPAAAAKRATATPRAASPPRAPAIDPADGARAALVFAVATAALFAITTAVAFDRARTWWGADALRFAAPWFGWGPWILVALAFVPPLARPLAAALERLGDAFARHAFVATGGLAVVAMALVTVFPDRLWLVGDFLLRLGCTRGRIPVEIVFPQALPLDLFLHHHLPVAIARANIADPNAWERALGAIEAGLLAFAAVALARRLGLRGVAAVTCAGLVVFSGALGMFTGYGKGFVELTLITVLVAIAALHVVREGRGAWTLAVLLVTGILFHRSALALYLTLGVVVVAWSRSPAARHHGRGATLAAFAAPVVAAALCAPILIASMQVTDVRHLAPAGATPAAILGAAFAPAHLADVLDLIVHGAPFALAAPFLAIALARPLRARGAETLVLASLVIPALFVLLFVHPRQGVFRDSDVFAPSLAALALVAAALAGEALRGAPQRATVAVPAVLLAFVTTLASLSITADLGRGTQRVRAYLEGPPRRPDEERALLWAYVAERTSAAHRFDDAIDAYEHAAELAPSPRILMEWALAQEDRRDPRAAQPIYRRVTERAPTFTDGWLGLAGVSLEIGDTLTAREAIDRAEALEPARPEAPSMRRALARMTGANAGAAPPPAPPPGPAYR